MNGQVGMRAFPMFLAMLLVSVVVVPAVSANELVVLPEPEITLTQQEIDCIYATLMDDIKSSDIDVDVKKDLLQSLDEVRNNTLSDAEKLTTLTEVAEILLNQGSGGVSIQWSGYIGGGPAPHNDMARIAGQKMGLSSAACAILNETAADPDDWGDASLNHYSITGAPDQAERYANLARDYLHDDDLSNDDLGYTCLAYSLHFMTDMSQPFHYAPVYLANHQAYESYVHNNWTSGKNYRSDVELNWYYYYISDVSDSAGSLASASYQYMNYIRSTMDQYSNWGMTQLSSRIPEIVLLTVQSIIWAL
ncbi:hypothetical protein [Methanoculleus sp.]|uniref:hypothetical protein n=1 Tax=Methanoculleus sp. TaxID=90427 RepID=UPI00272E3CAB|nr:hypothetical protein [Methanoculleus sp.]